MSNQHVGEGSSSGVLLDSVKQVGIDLTGGVIIEENCHNEEDGIDRGID